jgi:hypothetical protein
MANGLDTSIGYAVEVTDGTFVTPTDWFEVLPPLGIGKRQNYHTSRGLRSGRRLKTGKVLGAHWIDGPIGHELVAEGIGILFRGMIDPTPATTGAGPYQHVFTFSTTDPATLSIQEGLPSLTAVHPISYAGCRVSKWTIRCNPGSVFPELILEFLGKSADVDGTPSLTTPTYPTFTRFSFIHGVPLLAGSALCADSFEITCDMGLTNQPRICAADAGGPNLLYQTKPTITGSFTTDMADMTQLNRHLNGTEAAVSMSFNAGASAILTLAGNAMFTGEFPRVENEGYTKQGIPFEFMSGTSDAAAFTATLTNTDATA